MAAETAAISTQTVLTADECRVFNANVLTGIPAEVGIAAEEVQFFRSIGCTGIRIDRGPEQVGKIAAGGVAVAAVDHESEAFVFVDIHHRTDPFEGGEAVFIAPAAEHQEVVAVAGTHFLTRCSGMVAHIRRTPQLHTATGKLRLHTGSLVDVRTTVRFPVIRGNFAVTIEVFQQGDQLFFRQSLIVAVDLTDQLKADVLAEEHEEVFFDIKVSLRFGQNKGQHADFHRDGADIFAVFRLESDRALVKTGSLLGIGMDRQEELLEFAFVQRGTLEDGGVREVGLHAAECFVQTVSAGVFDPVFDGAGSGQPAIGHGAVRFGQTGVVTDFFRIDLDQVFIVEQEFRAEFQAGVLEVAVPAVAVLIPDLDGLQVQFVFGKHFAIRRLQVADNKIDFTQIFQGIDQEGAGFVLILRHHNTHRNARFAVERINVRQVLGFTGGRNAVMDKVRRAAGEIASDTDNVDFLFFRLGAFGMGSKIALFLRTDLRILPEPFFRLLRGRHFNLGGERKRQTGEDNCKHGFWFQF